MSATPLRGLIAIAWLELRDIVNVIAVPIIVALIPIAFWLVSGTPRQADPHLPVLAFLAAAPLAAALLGGEAIAGERAAGTWGFLTARAVRLRDILLVKAALRGAACLIVLGSLVLVVNAWSATGRAEWMPGLDAPARLGLRLSLIAVLACFACAFIAGRYLADAIVASAAGLLGGTALTLIALAPGWLAAGSAREAIEFSPRSWRDHRAVLAGRATPGLPALLGPAGTAVAFTARPAGREDSAESGRAVIATLAPDGTVEAMTVLPRGTQPVRWEDAGSLRVAWPAREGSVERIVSFEGATHAPPDADADRRGIDGAAPAGGHVTVTAGALVVARAGKEPVTAYPPKEGATR